MRILVVEDETKMARAIRRGLENEGYAAETVATGDDAVFWASEQEFDAIVLDVMLPGMDGYAVCRTLRDASVWTPVLMLTARGAVEDRIAGLDAGADDYLVKPFAFGELLARLRALLRRGPAERTPEIVVGDIVVDPAAHSVTRAGVSIDLSPREFALLEFLAMHSGEVVRRSEILDHVWDYGYDGMSNVVDVYVGYLRKKIEKPFKSKVIRAVRGVGYILEPRP
ncbi:MAG: response regulator transcription factor [Coriobacteriia bacterium]|nr:response regulator transcription factor [Coriobacteriia bacterium]